MFFFYFFIILICMLSLVFIFAQAIKKHLEYYATTIGAIASIVAVVAGIAALTVYIYDTSQKYELIRDKKFTGIWTNPSEGCIDCVLNNDPNKPIILQLQVTDGFISGVLDASSWLDKKFSKKENVDAVIKEAQKIIHGYLNVEGSFLFNTGTINIWDYIDGEAVLYAKAKISLKGEMLKFKVVKEGFPGIPKTAEMFKTFNDEGETCSQILADAPWICADYKTNSEMPGNP